MRIRLHKSRSTASTLAIGVLVAGIATAGAFNVGHVRTNVAELISPSNSSAQQDSPGKSLDNHGKECDVKTNSQGDPVGKSVNNTTGNGETIGNGAARDCVTPSESPSPTPTQTSPGTPTSGGNIVAASPSASPTAGPKVEITDLLKTYNSERQGATVTTSPADARCRVTYDGSIVLPRNAGTYQVVATCKTGTTEFTATAQLVIQKANPVLTWVEPKPITTKDSLSARELNAKSDVRGTYIYTPSKGAKFPASTQKLNVEFTPADELNYNVMNATVNLLVTGDKFKGIVVPFSLSSSGISPSTRSTIRSTFRNSGITQVTVSGYAQPSKNKKADLKLSLERANEVAAQLKAIVPGLKVTVKAYGSQLNPACKSFLNKCVVVK